MAYEIEIDINNDLAEIAEEIDAYSYTILLILQVCDDLNISKPASAAINFRDSFHHFIHLYESCESENILNFICQKASIEEHLSRGIKDTLIHIASHIVLKINKILQSPALKKIERKTMRMYLHRFKNSILDIRLESISIERITNEVLDQFKTTLQELITSLKDFNQYEIFLQKVYAQELP